MTAINPFSQPSPTPFPEEYSLEDLAKQQISTSVFLPAPDTTFGKSRRRTWRLQRGKAAIENLAPAWHELLRTTSSSEFFHQPEWICSLLPMLEDSQVLLYTEDVGRELSAVIPLIQGKYTFSGIPLRSVALLHNGYSPYTDYILREDCEANGLATRLTGALRESRIPWDLLFFPNASSHSHVARDLRNSPSGMQIIQHKRVSDYFRTEPYEETLKRFSSNFRGNLRKARNKLLELPNVRFEWHRELDDIKRAFPEFLQVEASGWKWLEGTSILQTPEAVGFYEQLIEQFGPHGQCGIHLLKQGDHTLAGQFALYQGGVCSVIKIGYDETFSRLAPGNMLLEALLKKHQDGTEVREINLISGTDWHQTWKPLPLPIDNYFLFNFSSRALLAYSLYHGKNWTGQLRNPGDSTSKDH